MTTPRKGSLKRKTRKAPQVFNPLARLDPSQVTDKRAASKPIRQTPGPKRPKSAVPTGRGSMTQVRRDLGENLPRSVGQSSRDAGWKGKSTDRVEGRVYNPKRAPDGMVVNAKPRVPPMTNTSPAPQTIRTPKPKATPRTRLR